MRHALPALLLTLTTSLTLGACNGKQDASTPSPSAKAQEAPSVLDAYIAIQTTLANDKLDSMPELSAKVITAADALQGKPGIDAVLAGAGRTAASDIATARTGFKKMSYGLLTYLAANPTLQAEHEIIFCPMAFNNKGAHWVQKKGEIINPYHGKMMLHCGDRVAWDAEIKPPPA